MPERYKRTTLQGRYTLIVKFPEALYCCSTATIVSYHPLSMFDWQGHTCYRRASENDKGVNNMAKKEILDKLSIYVPQKKMDEKPVERLIRLASKRDRSVNYLVVEAILEYLKREEKKG